MVLADYRGLTHQQLEGLKKALKNVEAELVVTKNTLLKRAMGSSAYTLDTLEGPTATLFAYGDILTPLKELAKIIRLLKLPVIKLAFLEGKILTGEETLKLATLPPRDVLIAQVVLGMKAPIFGLHHALNWNIQKLVMTLKTIEKTK